jgi:rhodanese-related sulfurtransferase
MTLLISSTATGQTVFSPSQDLASIRAQVANNEAVLIDVREQSEWNQCHLKAATLIPLSAMRDESQQSRCVANLKQNMPIYCHCKAGYRAKTAAQILEQLGFDATPITQAYGSIVDSGFEEAVKP